MKHLDLAEELGDFWLPALVEKDWAARLSVLNEVHAQLYEDLETATDYQVLSRLFVAVLIERLGAPPVGCAAQAEIYQRSADAHHRAAGFTWQRGGKETASPVAAATTVGKERRRWPRYVVDLLAEMWVQGRWARWRLVDLSCGGAHLASLDGGPAPQPGTLVRLAVPAGGVRDAVVVFAGRVGIGVEFSTTQIEA